MIAFPETMEELQALLLRWDVALGVISVLFVFVLLLKLLFGKKKASSTFVPLDLPGPMTEELNISTLALSEMDPFHTEEELRVVRDLAKQIRRYADGRRIFNINSTGKGGGVAEMLKVLVAYARDLGVDMRWLVLGTDNEEFFGITKRMHNAIHGAAGDGRPLGQRERNVYERVTKDNTNSVLTVTRPGDVVIVHDPQPAGLIGPLVDHGCHVIWRCHIGLDKENEHTNAAWKFLLPYVRQAHAFVFSRPSYVPKQLKALKTKVCVIAPSVDPRAPKNQPLSRSQIAGILRATELVQAPDHEILEPTFVRDGGSIGTVTRKAQVVREGGMVSFDTPLVVQVSRWDGLKDHPGVLKSFASMIEQHPDLKAHLMLVGPSVEEVKDDPEGLTEYHNVKDTYLALPEPVRKHISIVTLPMDDVEENAAMVNALQRHAHVIVQKSLQEGFGLTVTEGMWKGKPVVASPVGGILEQIVPWKSGVLLKHPKDLEGLADALYQLLTDKVKRDAIGKAAKERVRELFTSLHSLRDYARLILSIV